MSMEPSKLEPSKELTLEQAVADILLPQGAICTAYVVIAEYMNVNGEKELAVDYTSDMTDWMRDGMIQHALSKEDWRDIEDDEEDDE